MKNDGTTLEKYVERIEKYFRPTNAIITRNEIIDTKYGPREFDITVRLPHESGGMALIVFEAKDWRGKPPIGVVEAFIQKCKVAKVTQGIMISSNGFSKPSIEQAKDYNITLLQVADSEHIDWKREIKLPYYIDYHCLDKILVYVKRVDEIPIDVNSMNFEESLTKRIIKNIEVILEKKGSIELLRGIYKADGQFQLTNGRKTIDLEVKFRLLFKHNVYFKPKSAVKVTGYENLNEKTFKLRSWGHSISNIDEEILTMKDLGDIKPTEYGSEYSISINIIQTQFNSLYYTNDPLYFKVKNRL